MNFWKETLKSDETNAFLEKHYGFQNMKCFDSQVDTYVLQS